MIPGQEFCILFFFVNLFYLLDQKILFANTIMDDKLPPILKDAKSKKGSAKTCQNLLKKFKSADNIVSDDCLIKVCIINFY